MQKKYPTLVHEWFEEVWNQQKTATIDRLLADDAVAHGLVDDNGQEIRGVAAFKEFHRRFLDAFPNVRVEVADTVAEDDRIVGRCIVRAVHRGDGLGFKATGRETQFTGICIAHIRDGKIAESWNSFDFLTMHTQLGTLAALSS